MRSASAHGVLLLALALASCRDDSTSAPTQPVPPGARGGRSDVLGVECGKRAHLWPHGRRDGPLLGYNQYGQLGIGTSTGPAACMNPFSGTVENVCSTYPVPVTGAIKWGAISTGGNHTCAIALDGVAYCWGDSYWGQMGTGTTTSAAAPSGRPGRADVRDSDRGCLAHLWSHQSRNRLLLG